MADPDRADAHRRCLLVIGNEVLSGRTQDANIHFLATRPGRDRHPAARGADHPRHRRDVIIGTVNEVRARFDHVFTTGGIGPTHDDITSECIAAAFGVPWEPHPEAWARMERSYKPGEFNAGAAAHGHHAARRRADREPDLHRARLHHRQRARDGRRAADHAGDVRKAGAAAAGGTPIVSRAVHALGAARGQLADGLAAIQRASRTLISAAIRSTARPATAWPIVAKGPIRRGRRRRSPRWPRCSPPSATPGRGRTGGLRDRS